jgi:transposase-like protein
MSEPPEGSAAPEPATASSASKPARRPKYRRRRQGTAHWHLSRRAVDISLSEVLRWDEANCRDFLVEARWGSPDTIRCPHCGTVTRHYTRPKQKRWACRGCRRCFSLMSGTVFDSHKLSLQELVAAALMWINSSGGQAALELRRHLRKSYNTTFVLQHKLREALQRGYNVGLLNGDLEVDASHQSGRRSWEKRGRPQVSMKITEATAKEDIEAAMHQSSRAAAAREARIKGSGRDEYGSALPPGRRLVMAVRKRSGSKGLGAVATRIAIVLSEQDSGPATRVMEDFAAVSESTLNSDASPAFGKIGGKFRGHRTVEHSARLVGENGENNNLVEELNFRLDRAEGGTYLNIEAKYLYDYAVEVAFRADTRRLPNREQLKLLLNIALNVGMSRDWRGFTHGQHRKIEKLHRNPTAAPSSGPPKGRPRRVPR